MLVIMTSWQFWCILVISVYLLVGFTLSTCGLLFDEDLRNVARDSFMLLLGYLVVTVLWPLVMFGAYFCDADGDDGGDKVEK